MSKRLIELARRIERQPWNRPGVDKTWVLNAMWQHHLLQQEVRRSRRAAS